MHRPAAVISALLDGVCCAPRLAARWRSQQLNDQPIISETQQREWLTGRIRVVFVRRTMLLLPGGDVDLETSNCTRVAKKFYNLALKANDAGDYFPIWAVCQGFQQLSYLTANKNLLTPTNTKSIALPLTITPAARCSRLFQGLPKDVWQSLAKKNITSNFHKWSLSTQNFSRNANLRSFYRVVTTSTDGKTEFISTMEAYHYPFCAVQWHPEKSAYEWIDKPGMVHTMSAVKANFYTARFFVSEATKNHHKFPSDNKENESLIYNFEPVFKDKHFIFMQMYYFD